MTVSDLISKLSGLPDEAIVLVDRKIPSNSRCCRFPEPKGTATTIATGVAYKLFDQNSGANAYSDEQNGYSPVDGELAVYIGTGETLNGLLWCNIL